MNSQILTPVCDPAGAMLWFDLDDTLWDMWGNSVLCLRELYESQELDRWFPTYDDWDAVYHHINRELWDQYGRGDITRDYLRSERFARPLRIGGVDPGRADEMAVDFDRMYLESLGQKTALVPGAKETLEYLWQRGYRMGIVSNGFREVQYNKLKSSAIDRYFDPVVLSDEAGVNKPSPRFFDYALDRAESHSLRNIIIGDNLKADIDGALDYGLEAIWLDASNDNVGDRTENPRFRKITHLTELKDVF